MKVLSYILVILSLFAFRICIAGDSVWLQFHDELSKMPYTKLKLNYNGFVSVRDGNQTKGCEVVFESHEARISGAVVYQKFGSFINRPGYLMNNKKVR